MSNKQIVQGKNNIKKETETNKLTVKKICKNKKQKKKIKQLTLKQMFGPKFCIFRIYS